MSGTCIFAGLSVGLAAFKLPDCEELCAWDAGSAEICAVRASHVGSELHVLLAVDEMGRCGGGFPWLLGGGCALELLKQEEDGNG